MYTKEELLRAKIPCQETGIEVKKGMCAICSPGNHCGLDVYVRNGRILKVEGTKEWVRTNRIVDPAVEEYEAGKPVEIEQPEMHETPSRE